MSNVMISLGVGRFGLVDADFTPATGPRHGAGHMARGLQRCGGVAGTTGGGRPTLKSPLKGHFEA